MNKEEMLRFAEEQRLPSERVPWTSTHPEIVSLCMDNEADRKKLAQSIVRYLCPMFVQIVDKYLGSDKLFEKQFGGTPMTRADILEACIAIAVAHGFDLSTAAMRLTPMGLGTEGREKA